MAKVRQFDMRKHIKNTDTMPNSHYMNHY